MRRTKKTITYHGRKGRPFIHTAKNGRKYVMVRAPGGGTRRLYEDSFYREGDKGGKRRKLRLV